jgi:hypothetical protein
MCDIALPLSWVTMQSAYQPFLCWPSTATGHLLSRWHSGRSAPPHPRLQGINDIHVEVRTGNVMAGAGWAAGPAQIVCHQPPGTTIIIYCNYCGDYKHTAGSEIKTCWRYAADSWFEPRPKQLFTFVFCVHGFMNLYIQCMYLVWTWFGHNLNKYISNMYVNAGMSLFKPDLSMVCTDICELFSYIRVCKL